jgi:hypothetical protein
MRFRVKNNLTEINHKVSVHAKCPAKFCRCLCGEMRGLRHDSLETSVIIDQGAVMQEAFTGSWARESHLSVEHLNSLRDLNHRFLDLAGAKAQEWTAAGRRGLSTELAAQVAPLSRVQRAAAANCPYALFDLRFDDGAHWNARLQSGATWRVADESKLDDDTVNFVRLALFYAWHVASSAGFAAQLLLGVHSDTAHGFRRLTINGLPTLALSEAANLTARWSGCSAYWNSLMHAASSADGAALRRVQLYGLQVAAAARLPTP